MIPNKARLPLIITLVVLGLLVMGFFFFAGVYADILWFNQLGFLEVLTTQWIATGAMFILGFLGMAVPLWVCLEISFRSRPVYAKLNSQLDRYQEIIEPLRKLATWGIPAAFGVLAGMAAAASWPIVLAWWFRTPGGNPDPQFGLDVSFYLFELPFYKALLSFVSAVVLISALLSIAVAYIYGSIRISTKELAVAKAARIQISVLVGLFILVQAATLWMSQYDTMTSSSSGLLTGPSYTDANSVIPALQIVAAIAVLVALLFVVTSFTGKWRLPIIGTALLIVSSLLIVQAYPFITQRFQVDPNEATLESEYLQRNMDATRTAFGVADVEKVPYNAISEAEAGALREDAETTTNIRLIDPALITDTFRQEEQNKQYYRFPTRLDVDRYMVDGKVQDTVIALRELNQAGLGTSQSWVNNTIIYTHGFGAVSAYGNRKAADGLPEFMESGIPSTGILGDYEERIYFGEYSPKYSIVGGPDGIKPEEIDYPNDSDDDNSSAAMTTFKGNGGPKLDSLLNRLVYSLKFQSEQILFSQDVNEESQILYDRHPAVRVGEVAPYLTLDSDPYPAIVDGRIVWIIDAYTTSDQYPYSSHVNLNQAITDYYTQPGLSTKTVNYIRNSVKATVDAYDGKVTLYAWDTEDPVLATWNKIFPNSLTPISEMSAELMQHVRYPSDMFKLQRQILGKYHVGTTAALYSGSDAWITPGEPTASAATAARLQPPYYLSMKLPNEDESSFKIYSTYIIDARGSESRNVLTGYLAANADAGAVAGQRSPDYGKLTLLTLPKTTTVNGPGQMQANFNSNTNVANQLALLEQGGRTTVERGNLLTLPVGGGLLYVQPVYVRATGETTYPLLRKVLVGFGNEIAFENTLGEALDVLFGGDSGVDPDDHGDPSDPVQPGDPVDPNDPGTENPDPGTPSNGVLANAIADAIAAVTERDAAMAAGDWAAYGVADAKLQSALKRAEAALK
ncbi:MAG: UPF0182 family protein [Microbacteriaceae bacterium]